MASSDLRFGGVYTAVKSVLLVAAAGALWATAKVPRPIKLTVQPKLVAMGETVTFTVLGPANEKGELVFTSDYGAKTDRLPFALDSRGTETIKLTPRDAGSADVVAVMSGDRASNSVTFAAWEGTPLPNSSVFVFGPKPNAEVGNQVYIRGKGDPGTAVKVTVQGGEPNFFRTDPSGEWGGVLGLSAGTRTISVSANGSSVNIPVKVQ